MPRANAIALNAPCKSLLSLKKMLLLIRPTLMEICSLGLNSKHINTLESKLEIKI